DANLRKALRERERSTIAPFAGRPERREQRDELGVGGVPMETLVLRAAIDVGIAQHLHRPRLRVRERRVVGGRARRLDRECMEEMQPTRDIAMLAQRTDEPHELFAVPRFDLVPDHNPKNPLMPSRIRARSAEWRDSRSLASRPSRLAMRLMRRCARISESSFA